MNNKRIVEEIDSDGVSRFYPERKGVLWGWNRVFAGDAVDYLNFDTYKEAKEWVCFEHTVETNIREVNCNG